MLHNVPPVSDWFFSFSYLGVLGYRRDSACDRLILALGCCNYLRKTELLFTLIHCTKRLLLCQKAAYLGLLFSFPFFNPCPTDRIASLLYFLKTSMYFLKTSMHNQLPETRCVVLHRFEATLMFSLSSVYMTLTLVLEYWKAVGL